MQFRIRLKKKNREEVLEEHPNLTAPINYTLKTFQATEDLYNLKDDQYQELVQQLIQKGCRVPDRELEEKETVDIVLDIKNEADTGREPVWEGEVKLPDWMRSKQTDQTNEPRTLPQPLRTLLHPNKQADTD